MNFLNIPKLMRLRQEAQDKRNWHAELHYGSLAIASGMVWGLIVGGAASGYIFFIGALAK